MTYAKNLSKAVKGIEEVLVEEVLVVREFPNVFPEELSDLPTKREVEFSIEVVSGITPIAKTPYRITNKRVVGVKGAVAGVLDRGFIRPNRSP